jgi:cell division protein ZapA
MAQVSLQVNGYAYVLGCADGEEQHLLALAAELDRRIQDIKAATGPGGEARLLLMAALMLSDELHDLREYLQQQPAPAESGAQPAAAPRPEPKAGRRLRGLTKRAEAIADSVEALPLAATPEAEPPS